MGTGAGLVAKVKQIKTLVNMGKTAVSAAEALSEAIASGTETAIKIIASDETVTFKDAVHDVAKNAAIGGGAIS